MHYEKYGSAAAGIILMHSDRGIDSPDTHNHSNPNIDSTRTHLNYDLKDRGGITAYAYYKRRIDDIADETKKRTGKAIRKDAVTLCSWVVTAPCDLPEDKLSDFFKVCYAWFSERYGADNIVTAAVHMDETSPHIHLQFTPIIEKDGIRKLCAKDIETRGTLKSAHQMLQKRTEQELGCRVSILNGATAGGNLSIAELKIREAQKELTKIKAESVSIDTLTPAIVATNNMMQDIIEQYNRLENALRAKKWLRDNDKVKLEALSKELTGLRELAHKLDKLTDTLWQTNTLLQEKVNNSFDDAISHLDEGRRSELREIQNQKKALSAWSDRLKQQAKYLDDIDEAVRKKAKDEVAIIRDDIEYGAKIKAQAIIDDAKRKIENTEKEIESKEQILSGLYDDIATAKTELNNMAEQKELIKNETEQLRTARKEALEALIQRMDAINRNTQAQITEKRQARSHSQLSL